MRDLVLSYHSTVKSTKQYGKVKAENGNVYRSLYKCVAAQQQVYITVVSAGQFSSKKEKKNNWKKAFCWILYTLLYFISKSQSLQRRTSAVLAFPLMSASSSLSSSLSFLMQSKYSFCLSKAWPHTWAETGEGRRGRGHIGETQNTHATHMQWARIRPTTETHTQSAEEEDVAACSRWECSGGGAQAPMTLGL